jgi:ATPase subunit of ABC transporter with duplicated ATPase domains
VSKKYEDNVPKLVESLKEILPGFNSLFLREAGMSQVLMANFNVDGKSPEYHFGELSDGQRALIVLYTIVLGLRGQGYSLFLDEPDNWLSLREIQPWLRTLHDACTKDIEQAVIISHHPGIIDYLGPSMGHWFDRQENGTVQVNDKAPEDAGDLRLSEIIARGWYQ